MYPKPIERLIRHFQKLPGIGPKQAAKFAFRILAMRPDEVHDFAAEIKNIQTEVTRCRECRLSFSRDSTELCPICRDSRRNREYVCIVETERDAYTIEQAHAFSGVYHVLGERVSLRGEALSPTARERLETRLSAISPQAEVILAMNATTDGQAAALYLEQIISSLGKKVSRLGRGLSSGVEIEYADRDTLLDAFQNRK